MLIKRTSILTGVTRERDLPVTQEQINRWMAGEYIQNAMPHLSASDREFIKTGITDEEWNDGLGSDEDEEEPL